MQAGGRRGDGAGLLRIDGLVTLFVDRVGGMIDVRRQRQAAMRFDQVEHVGVERQGKKLAGALAYHNVECIGQADPVARLGRLRGAHLRQHRALAEHALDQHFDIAAGFLDAEKARLQHARVVHHQQVARSKQIDDVAELAVDDRVAVELQQARRAALGKRDLGDAVRRQVEIEVGERILRWGHKRGHKRVH